MQQKTYIDTIELRLENVGLFREYRLDLTSGAVVEASGGNGRGKTTLLNSLLINLTGKDIPDFLTTYGETQTVVETRVAGLFIRRVIEDGKTAALEVIDSRGELVKKPATFLKGLFGAGEFLDPVTLIDMRPIDRAKTIANALDLDTGLAARRLEEITGKPWPIATREDIFPAITQAHDTLYDQRRQTRSAMDSAAERVQAMLDSIPVEWKDADGQVPAPIEPAPLGDIYIKHSNAVQRNRRRLELQSLIAQDEMTLQQLQQQLDVPAARMLQRENALTNLGPEEDTLPLRQEIDRLTNLLLAMEARNRDRDTLAAEQAQDLAYRAALEGQLTAPRQRLEDYRKEATTLGAPEDVDEWQARIDTHEDRMEEYKEALRIHGDTARRYQQARDYDQEAQTLRLAWEALEAKVKALDRLPIDLLDGVQMPIPGMVVSGTDIFLPEGDKLLPLDAFGEADRYRFCTQLAMALAPVNLVIMDGVERCDEERRQALYQLLADAGFVAFSTRVTGGPLQVSTYSPAAQPA